MISNLCTVTATHACVNYCCHPVKAFQFILKSGWGRTWPLHLCFQHNYLRNKNYPVNLFLDRVDVRSLTIRWMIYVGRSSYARKHDMHSRTQPEMLMWYVNVILMIKLQPMSSWCFTQWRGVAECMYSNTCTLISCRGALDLVQAEVQEHRVDWFQNQSPVLSLF